MTTSDVQVDEARSGRGFQRRTIQTPEDPRRIMYYLGGFIFAAMAILLVVVFVRKFRQSND